MRFITLLCISSGLFAQYWYSLQGPEGMYPSAIKFLEQDLSDNQLLIGMHQQSWDYSGGIYKSYNQGRRWLWRSKGLSWVGHIRQIDQDPFNPNIIYSAQGISYWSTIIGRPYGQIYKSTDGGETWSSIAPYDSVWWAVHCSRRHPGVILISGKMGTYRSTNSGNNWQLVLNAQGTEFTFDPNHPDTIYLGTISNYICRSTNGGLSWETNIGNSLPTSVIWSIAVDPQSSQILYAVPALWSNQFGLYRSTDYGNSWNQVLSSSVWFVRVSPLNPNIVWAGGNTGVWLSTDRGQNWVNKLSRACRYIAPFPHNQNGITASIFPSPSSVITGFILSTDLGNSWEARNFRTKGVSVRDFAFPYIGNYQTIYAVTRERLSKTTNGGKLWNFIPTPFSPLAIDMRGDTIIAGGGQGGIWKSINAGNSWIQSSGISGYSEIQEIEFHRANARHIWAAVSNNSNEWGIWKSTDAGVSFFRMTGSGTDLPTYSIATHPTDSNIILAGTIPYMPFVGDLIVRTTNGGTNWTIVHNGQTNPSTGGVLSIKFAPSNPNIVYACGPYLLIKSTDGGSTWDYSLPTSNLDCREIAVSPVNPLEVFAVGSYVWHSSNGGLSWQNWSYDLWDSSSSSIQILNNENIYLGNINGLYRFNNIPPDTVTPSVTVIQPNGGEVLWSGQNYNIMWNASDNLEVDGIDIFYSVDAGTLYQGISYNELNDGVYSWTVPNTPSNQCYVRIDAYDFAGNRAWDRSDNYFSIQQLSVEEKKPEYTNGVLLEVRGLGKPRIYCTVKTVPDWDFSLYNLVGQRVYNYNSKGFIGTKVFDLDFLPSGVYFAVLNTNSLNGVIKKAVVIK
ncbi:MAG: T9SS type A sorting domain-containing protein [candidate division WOR-3 bacterium]